MEYDVDLGVKFFAILSVTYIFGVSTIAIAQYCWGLRGGVVSLLSGLLIIAGLAVFLASPVESGAFVSWLEGLAEVILILGTSWIVLGTLALVASAFIRRKVKGKSQV